MSENVYRIASILVSMTTYISIVLLLYFSFLFVTYKSSGTFIWLIFLALFIYGISWVSFLMKLY